MRLNYSRSAASKLNDDEMKREFWYGDDHALPKPTFKLRARPYVPRKRWYAMQEARARRHDTTRHDNYEWRESCKYACMEYSMTLILDTQVNPILWLICWVCKISFIVSLFIVTFCKYIICTFIATLYYRAKQCDWFNCKRMHIKSSF